MIGIALLDPHRYATVRAELLAELSEFLATEPSEHVYVDILIQAVDEATPALKAIAASMERLATEIVAAGRTIYDAQAKLAEDAANRRHAERTAHP